jgi:hypothetical protein
VSLRVGVFAEELMHTVTVMAGRPRKFPAMEYLASAADLVPTNSPVSKHSTLYIVWFLLLDSRGFVVILVGYLRLCSRVLRCSARRPAAGTRSHCKRRRLPEVTYSLRSEISVGYFVLV